MAKILQVPKTVGPEPNLIFKDGRIDYAAYESANEAWLQKLRDWAKEHGSGEYAGEIIKLPVADNYARYMVVSLKPAKLIHVPLYDGYQYRGINRFTARDIEPLIEQERAWAKLFASRRTMAFDTTQQPTKSAEGVLN